MILVSSELLNDRIRKIYVDDNGLKTELILSLDEKKLYFCNTELEVLELPDFIEVVEDNAISTHLDKTDGHLNNFNLKKIICSRNLKTIKDFAFSGSNITSIDLANVNLIGSGIFSHCHCLEYVKLPSGLAQIPAGLFRNCLNLKEIDLPASVVFIDDDAFAGTAIETIDLSNVERFGNGIFQDCKNLKSVILPETMTHIPDNMFKSCANLSIEDLLKNISSIGDFAFSGCFFNSFDASNIRTFGSGVFKDCRELKNIILPSDITSITSSMFEGCFNLTDFNLPSSVSYIGEKAFYGTRITNIDLSHVLSIDKGAFYGTHLTNVSWPRAVENISDNMFANSTLSSINIHDFVTTLGKGVFANCKYLTNINLPESICDIGKECFSGSSIKKISLPDKLKYISSDLCKNCVELEEVFFADDITSIGVKAFDGCKKLKRFIVPEKVTSIGKNAFSNCEKLEYFEITSSKTKVSQGVFDGCRSLRFVNYFGIPVKRKISYNNVSEFFHQLLRELQKEDELHKFENSVIDFNLSSLKLNNPDDCNALFKGMMLSIKNNEVVDFTNALENFDVVIFDKNISYLKSLGISVNDANMLVGEGFLNVLNCSFEEAKKNYEYLIDQRIIDREALGRLFFDDCSNGSFDDSMKAYIEKYGALPDTVSSLLVESNDSNKLELRDRLIYVSTLNLIDNSYNMDTYDKAKIMMKRTLYKNIIYDDKKKMDHINDDFYNIVSEQYPAMEGIGVSLYNKLNGIDVNWFSNLYRSMKYGGNSTAFDSFYNSLEMANPNRNFKSSLERATYLKNEIVARLLCADIMLTLEGIPVKFGQHYQRYIEQKKKMMIDGTSIDFSRLLKYASLPKDKLFINSSIVNAMLRIDPYSFDAFRVDPVEMDSLNKKSLQVKYAGIAKNFGYVFDDEEVDRYKKIRAYSEFSNGNVVNSYVEFINNAVGVAKIPEGDKSKYLDKVRAKAKAYLFDKNDEELFGFCRSLDLYLRSNRVYDREDADAINASKVVFDSDSDLSSDSRVMYCLYNLNRLAHDSLELNCKAALKNKFRIATTDVISYEKMEKVFKAYNYLYRYGIDSSAVDILIGSTRGFLGDVFKDMTSVPDEIKDYFNQNLALQFDKFRRRDVCEREISKDDVSGIKSNLEVISSLSEEEKDLIDLSIKEQSVFFECKKLFSEEIINRLATDISSTIQSVMNADLDTKREFYAEHGFIAEVQKDSRDNEVLVCLCEAFNEPFSVHLKDLPSSIKNQLSGSNYEQTIAHCALNSKGLTLRDSDFDNDLMKISGEDNFVGFRGNDYFCQAIRSNYDNYDVPARIIRQRKSELFSMLDESNRGNVDVISNTDGVYSKK